MLEETAAFPLITKLLGQVGADGAQAFVRAGSELWARFGYTTAQEGRATPGTAAMLRKVADAGGLKIDVAVYPDMLVDREFIKKTVSPTYANRMRIAGAKLTIDGSPQGFTAWRDRPYYKPVGNYPPGYARLRRGEQRAGARRDRLGLRERRAGHHPRQRRVGHRPAHRRAHCCDAEERRGQGPPPGADPRPVPARRPGGCVQAPRRDPVALPDAHVLLGRLAHRPRRSGRCSARTSPPPAGRASAA